jgi:hypothetical protein
MASLPKRKRGFSHLSAFSVILMSLSFIGTAASASEACTKNVFDRTPHELVSCLGEFASSFDAAEKIAAFGELLGAMTMWQWGQNLTIAMAMPALILSYYFFLVGIMRTVCLLQGKTYVHMPRQARTRILFSLYLIATGLAFGAVAYISNPTAAFPLSQSIFIVLIGVCLIFAKRLWGRRTDAEAEYYRVVPRWRRW